MKNGMSGHQSANAFKDEWLTPQEIVDALGEFDLDPCASFPRPWSTAKEHLTKINNGLDRQWHGRVWLNPPYGTETGKWMARMAEHGNGIALIFARTETEVWFKHIWSQASAVFFFKGRLFFCHVDGRRSHTNAGAPSALIAYGSENVTAIRKSNLSGHLCVLRPDHWIPF